MTPKPARMMALIEGDFAIFLIGMRLSRPWRIDRWVPLALSMGRMLRELRQGGVDGYLGAIPGLPVTVVYWRSWQALEAWARDPAGSHFPAMAALNRQLAEAGGDIGFWHETYLVRDGQYEAVYSGMRGFGLGAAGRLVPVTPERATARQRLKTGQNATGG